MALVASAIDFILDEFNVFGSTEKSKNHSGTTNAGLKGMLLICYALMFVVVLYAHDMALIQWKRGWSWITFVYFLSSCCQLLGLSILSLKVHSTRSVAGLSSQSIILLATSLFFRLLATTFADGYLPADKSADYMVQCIDGLSFCCALYLLYAMHKSYVHTYQDEHDVMPIGSILLACGIAALFVHPGLNDDMFDVLWAFSLNVEVFQILPQLSLLAKVGGLVESTTTHYVVNTFLACLCRFGFWLWAIPGCKNLSSQSGGYSWDMEWGGIYILGAYLIEALFHADFAYFYVKAWSAGSSSVVLPALGNEI